MSEMQRHINIGTREGLDVSASWTRKPRDGYSESVGVQLSVPYTGFFDDLWEQALELVQDTRDEYQVSCELRRIAGSMGELVVRREQFRVPELEPEDEDLGESDNPTYSVQTSMVLEPLLTHPKFAGLSELELRALKAMLDGQDRKAIISNIAGTKQGTIESALNSPEAKRAAKYIEQGVTDYLSPRTEATARWRGSHNSYMGSTICTPPGGIKTPVGRNWMCQGAGLELNGSEVWSTASFLLSGAGGWDKYLYED